MQSACNCTTGKDAASTALCSRAANVHGATDWPKLPCRNRFDSSFARVREVCQALHPLSLVSRARDARPSLEEGRSARWARL
eukprot:2497922-Alexandrium_andersonii.AAC.1